MERDVASAWHTANLTAAASVGKLPNLGEMLDGLKRKPLEQQSHAEQRSMIHTLAARIGGTVKRTKLVRVHG